MFIQKNKTDKNLINELIFQNIIEKRTARRWNIFFKILFFIFFLFIIASLTEFKNINFIKKKNVDHVAIIEINGMISDSSKNNSRNVIGLLDRAFRNTNAKAIIIKINSPGGTPVQSNIIHNYIKKLRNLNKNKDIYTVIEDLGTSGAYLIATATEKIYCDPYSIVGSIGVILSSFGFVDTINKLGIERRLYKSGKYKSMLDPFSERNVDEENLIQHNIDIVHKIFINTVKKNRPNLKLDEPDLFSGKIWIGYDALNIGLVDGFYDVYTLASNVIKVNNLIEYGYEKNFLDLFKFFKN